jgi:hypothetical protein
VFTVNSNLNPLLVSGVPYWLAISAVDPDTRIFWRENSTGQTGSLAVSNDFELTWLDENAIGGGPLDTPAFRVTGLAVIPESRFVALPVVGVLLVWGLARSVFYR